MGRVGEKGKMLVGDLRAYFQQTYGKNPESVGLTAVEASAAKKVPVNASPLGEYFTNRGKIPFQAGGDLHGLMRSEVYNFIDGKRSYYDIYKAVKAEAMAAGSWYYGTVSLEDVASLLDAGVTAKAWTVR